MNRISIALASLAALATSAAASPPAPAHGHGDHAATQSPEAVLKTLLTGNERFVAGTATRPHAGYARRSELVKGQHPVAAVIGCADSRVAPELLFDQGLGDLFVVRVAGNVAEPGVIGSVEYAAEHLGTPLVVVLGHEGCGAVKSTLDGAGEDGNLGSLVKDIRPGGGAGVQVGPGGLRRRARGRPPERAGAGEEPARAQPGAARAGRGRQGAGGGRDLRPRLRQGRAGAVIARAGLAPRRAARRPAAGGRAACPARRRRIAAG